MKEKDRVIHKRTQLAGTITKKWYWPHSRFELYAMQPYGDSEELLYGRSDDFEIVTLEEPP